jgi:hypothetical protein
VIVSAPAAMRRTASQVLQLQHFTTQLSDSPVEGIPGSVRTVTCTRTANSVALLDG